MSEPDFSKPLCEFVYEELGPHGNDRGDQVDLVKQYFETNPKADVNTVDDLKSTALYWTAMYDLQEVANYLVREKNADPNKADKNGITPLMRAAEYDHIEIAKLLCLESSANLATKSRDGKTAYQIAVDRGNTKIASFLAVDPLQLVKAPARRSSKDQ